MVLAGHEDPAGDHHQEVALAPAAQLKDAFLCVYAF
jgi:hypothetical protein